MNVFEIAYYIALDADFSTDDSSFSTTRVYGGLKTLTSYGRLSRRQFKFYLELKSFKTFEGSFFFFKIFDVIATGASSTGACLTLLCVDVR